MGDGRHADALVVAAHGRRGMLELAGGERHPFLVRGRRLRVLCGDRVHCTLRGDGGEALVQEVLERRNTLLRQNPRGGSPEPLAANVDLVLVVLAPVPEPDLWIADRYLCAAENMHSAAAIAWNKADLASGPPDALSDYAALGYPLHAVAALDGAGIDALASVFDGRQGILVGQSGVGKSTLINRLAPDAAADTAAVSAASGEGRHTTTASVMYRTATGRLMDTPGVRDFVPALPGWRDAESGFVEIRARRGQCRFADCCHLREPHCAVQAAVASGDIGARRYESYRRLLNLLQADDQPR